MSLGGIDIYSHISINYNLHAGSSTINLLDIFLIAGWFK